MSQLITPEDDHRALAQVCRCVEGQKCGACGMCGLNQVGLGTGVHCLLATDCPPQKARMTAAAALILTLQDLADALFGQGEVHDAPH